MIKPAPKLDRRTAKDITHQVEFLLAEYMPEEFRDPNTGNPKPMTGISAALVGIFARFSEIIIQRFNQVPDKNFLAFLDLLGASLLPPQPARVPLTFFLAVGSTVDAVVPAGTQVAAPPAKGEKDPVIFETERELVVTAAQLTSIFVRDPEQDTYSDRNAIAQPHSSSEVPVFQGNSAINHILYIAHDTLLGYPDLQSLTLKFDLEQAIQKPDARSLQWEIWDGEKGIPIPPSSRTLEPIKPKLSDTTENLTGDGTVVFTNLPQVPQQTVKLLNSIKSRWLRCRLQTRITIAKQAQPAMVRDSQLPSINRITLQATIGKSGQVIEYGFTNLLPVDLSKPFFPFGEKPRLGDTLYLTNQKAFSKSDAIVTLHVNLADLAAVGIELPKTDKEPEPTLEWEIWTSQGWLSVGTSTRQGPIAPLSETVKFQDTTQAFTVFGSDKVVKFILPKHLEETTINGIKSFWLRVRIAAGNYGKEASYVEDNKQPAGYSFKPATFKPPLINALKVDYTLTTSEQPPDHVITYNDFSYQPISPGLQFKPFEAIADSKPTLYLGFTLPPGRTAFPNRTISLYFRVADVVYDPTVKNPSPLSSPRLVWEYWSGKSQDWEKVTVRDETEALTRPGLVEFLPPVEFAAETDFGLDQKRYWLRVRWESGDYSANTEPKLRRVLLNTMIASQTVTIRNEILGSSDGTENQIVRTTRSPILKGQQLEVREPEMPSAQERERLETEEGTDAISFTPDATGRPQEIWVCWHEVPDFYGSGPRDRHYVLDHLTGEIQFGDGLNGLIPPIGTGNLRLARYQTGGGTAGNKPAGTIVQLKTTVPYVDKVTNTEAATGGADAETLDSLRDREPRKLRHNNRAVTLEDYEDLAMLASPAVARAKCIPLLNLGNNPLDVPNFPGQPPKAPGNVSVLIVPRSTDAKPLPSLELITRVQNYLEANSLPTVNISVVGPPYVSVNVTTEIALTSLEGASAVEQAVEQKLASFLHPLTGGLDGTGWTFGRKPHDSDLYALIEATPGVDHVRTLDVKEIEDQPGAEDTGRFLVYSGRHKINLFFGET